jgi:hypothetical protein
MRACCTAEGRRAQGGLVSPALVLSELGSSLREPQGS